MMVISVVLIKLPTLMSLVLISVSSPSNISSSPSATVSCVIVTVTFAEDCVAPNNMSLGLGFTILKSAFSMWSKT